MLYFFSTVDAVLSMMGLMPPPYAGRTIGLKRVLGLYDATMLVVGSVFGSGIFLTTGIIAGLVPYTGLIWLAWAAGGIITIAGAICYGELGSLYPKAGGPYVYLRKAFGPGASFLFGWLFFWIIGGGGIAALGVGFADYAQIFLPNWPRALLAVIAIVALTAINLRGVFWGARFQGYLAAVRIATVLIMIAGAASLVSRIGWNRIRPFWPSASISADSFSWTAFGTALIVVFWAYDGWYSANCAAEEIREPARTVPKALLAGTAAVFFLYLAANIVYSTALPMSEMRGLVRIGEAAAASLFGVGLAPVFGAVIAAAVFGCLAANILFCARVPYAMARDGQFFNFLGRIHSRSGSPRNALLAQMTWASLLCLTGTYERLVEFVMFAAVLFYAATSASVIVLRKKEPSAPRPYKVWGYPLLPAAYTAVNAAIMAALIVEEPIPALAGAGILLSGWPAFLFWRKRTVDAGRARPD